MADEDFNLVQAVADAGNSVRYCSLKEARQFLAMYRAVQVYDARKTADTSSLPPPQEVTDDHPWSKILD